MRGRSPRVLPLLLLAAGCAGTASSLAPREPALALVPAQDDAPASARDGGQGEPKAQERPTVATDDGSDWIRLASGEWLRGEIVVLDRETLEFDSEQLDTLKIDWTDVAEVRTSRSFTVLLDDRTQRTGVFDLDGGDAHVGAETIPRANLLRMVPGEPREANYWSGRLSFGMTARSGNTDQLDVTSALDVKRRTALTRFTLSYAGAYSELEDERSADNQRVNGQLDWFLGKQLYATPLGLEVYRDPFQNIALRVTPFAGLGYTLVDRAATEWSARLGLGYRWVRYESVAAGEDDTDGSPTAAVGTHVSHDLTDDAELAFDYGAQIGLEDASDTNQYAVLGLVVDLVYDLDLDVSLRWDRVGQPIPDDDGNRPEKDDLRLTVGLGWSF